MGSFPHPILVLYWLNFGLQRLQQTNLVVERVDELVELLGLCMDGVPGVLGVVPLGVQVFDAHALLLDPGVILQVVDSLALRIGQLQHTVGLEVQHMQVVIQLGSLCGGPSPDSIRTII